MPEAAKANEFTPIAVVGVPIESNNPAIAGPIRKPPELTKLFHELNFFILFYRYSQ